jgi:hypothetical protein
MDERVVTYIHRGKFLVDGWLRTEAALTVANLATEQRRLGVAGGTAEIGVHHGKLFILLYLLSSPPEKAVAIDLFEDQHLNIDSSGKGDLALFHANLERHADSSRLVLHKGDSTRLTGAVLRQLAEGPLRLISIDGGHTEEITASDLAVADTALAEGGIVVVDDVFNEMWPGVADGVHRYSRDQPRLVPFAICANKTFFCRSSHADGYRAAAIAGAMGHVMPSFLGHPVAVLHYLRPGLKDRVSQSAVWQGARATPPGRALRTMWNAGRRAHRLMARREDF